VNTLGGKDVAMKLIGHENPEIQRQALQSVSKIMVQSWEFMK
jgi:V-type H+-transporting ATPase subunit H